MKFNPVEVARQFLFVREAGQNKGQRVEAIQHWGGGIPGDSWCCWYATFVLDISFQGESPIPRLGRVQSVYDLAKSNHWMTTEPVAGDLFIYVDTNDHAHHIGFVTMPGTGIAGNTSADGKSSNGDRVAERPLPNNGTVKYIHYPR